MTVRKGYDREAQLAKLSEDSLRERLILAERVAVLWGWTGFHGIEGPREKAVHAAWKEWAKHVGPDLTGPKTNVELDMTVRIEEQNWKRING